jgi:hypothetical protein
MLRRHKSGKYAGQGMLCQVRALAGLVPLNSPAIGRATAIGLMALPLFQAWILNLIHAKDEAFDFFFFTIYIHRRWGLIDSLTSVIHQSRPFYKLNGEIYTNMTLLLRPCGPAH